MVEDDRKLVEDDRKAADEPLTADLEALRLRLADAGADHASHEEALRALADELRAISDSIRDRLETKAN